MWYLSILTKLYDAVAWAVRNPRLALELALVAMLLFVGWRYNRAQEALNQANAESGKLEDGLRQQIKLKDGELEILRREGGKVIVERPYVPPEGSVVIKQKDLEGLRARLGELQGLLAGAMDPSERKKLESEIKRLLGMIDGNDTEVIVKDKGFTAKPGFGLQWAGEGIGPRLDVKVFYWKRYSILFGGGNNGLDAAVSRHLDDVLWWRPKNIEAFGGYQFLQWGNEHDRIVLGIRANF